MKKALKLAKLLVDNDETRECPFCDKMEWGEKYHAKDCPFTLAYQIIAESDNG